MKNKYIVKFQSYSIYGGEWVSLSKQFPTKALAKQYLSKVNSNRRDNRDISMEAL